MSEPEKKPEGVEPTIGNNETHQDSTGEIKPAPAAANNNEQKAEEPVIGVTPVVDISGGKKEPVLGTVVPLPVVSNDTKVEPVVAETVVPAATDKPAAETPVEPAAPAAPVNDNAAVTAPAAEATQAVPPKKSGFLKKAFNFVASAATGAAVSMAAKTSVGIALGFAGAPAWLTIVAAGLAVGVGATLLADAKHRRAAKKEGGELSAYFSKAHGKELLSKRSLITFGISTAGALLGSAIALGFHEGVIQNAWHNIWHHTPTPPVEAVVVPPVIVAPVLPPVEHVIAPPPVETILPPVETVVAPIHCISPVEQFTDLVKGHHVSAQVTDALHRAASSNAHVAAQGTKDLAYYSQYGFGGVPKDHNVALELYKQAADAGNTQAKVDMLYLQHYGLDGVTPDKQASLSAMKDITHNARASEFVKAWGGAGKTLPHVDFDTKTILKGMPIGCPTPA